VSMSSTTSPPPLQTQGVAILCHPHPLHGGSLENKVVQTLARAFVQTGWEVIRFNFRGVGLSSGVYDNGLGELEDLMAVIEHFAPRGKISLGGFSFGAMITARALERLHTQREISRIVLVGLAVTRFEVPAIDSSLHQQTLLIHGQDDEVVPLSDVLSWVQASELPICVVPKTGHFFHGKLPLLKGLVARHVL
jgi:uncharacterized protein